MSMPKHLSQEDQDHLARYREAKERRVSGESPKLTTSPRRTPLKQKSVKQSILDARWAGIREATIYWLNRLDPDGARCNRCGRKARRYELHHVIPRSKAGAYTVSNSELLCAGPGSCHAKEHGEPQFSRTPDVESGETT